MTRTILINLTCHWHKLCLYLRHKLSPVTTYAANISIICRRRQFMPEILFVVDITGDNICCKTKSPALYCRSRSLFLSIFSIYCFLYLVNCSKGVLCYSYLYVNLCFKYKKQGYYRMKIYFDISGTKSELPNLC